MKSSFVAILLLSLTNCELLGGAEALPVQLDTDAASYRPGQEVMLTLTNTSRRAYTVSPTLCPAVLEQRDQSIWRPMQREEVCLAIGYELRSGNRLTVPRPLPDSLAAGDYRFMYELQDADGEDRYRRFERIEVYTKSFRVEP